MTPSPVYLGALLAALVALSPSDYLRPQPAGETVRPFLAALSVSSVERTAHWYATHLGFREVRAPNSPRQGIGNAILERHGFYLELASLAGSRSRASALPVAGQNGSLQGLYKLAFWVPNVDSAAAALTGAGVPIPRGIWSDSTFAGGTKSFLLEDPDGVVLQVFGPLTVRR